MGGRGEVWEWDGMGWGIGFGGWWGGGVVGWWGRIRRAGEKNEGKGEGWGGRGKGESTGQSASLPDPVVLIYVNHTHHPNNPHQ